MNIAANHISAGAANAVYMKTHRISNMSPPIGRRVS